jgi:hypothetical protein
MCLDLKPVTELSDGERDALKALTAAVYPPEVLVRSPGRPLQWATAQWSVLVWTAEGQLISHAGIVVRFQQDKYFAWTNSSEFQPYMAEFCETLSAYVAFWRRGTMNHARLDKFKIFSIPRNYCDGRRKSDCSVKLLSFLCSAAMLPV